VGRFGPYSWRSSPYEPPDYERFFPEDPKAARALAALWDEMRVEMDRQEANPNVPGRVNWWHLNGKHSDPEILRTVRRGLRGVDDERRIWVIRWIGTRYVVDADRQDADAIEILYHATDFPGHGRYDNATCRFAQGSVCKVRPKTPALLRALAELSMREDNPDILSNIVCAAWEAGPDQRAEMLADLAPYHASADPAVREKARDVARMLKGELDSWEWSVGPARRRALSKYGARLPEFREILRTGTARDRMRTLAFLADERIVLILDESFLAPIRACLDAPEEDVRSSVLGIVGEPWFWGHLHRPEAVAIVLRLLKDESPGIRDAACMLALNAGHSWPEAVVRAILDVALAGEVGREPDALPGGLRMSRKAAEKVLQDYLREGNTPRAQAARAVYFDLVGAAPPAPLAPEQRPGR
jgi:hypothetical protein